MTADPAMNARKAKHAVIVAHPDADSFTMAVARAYSETVAARGQVAVLRDLYRLGFDPVLKAAERPTGGAFTPAPDVAAELEELRGADIFVLVYPIWFGAPKIAEKRLANTRPISLSASPRCQRSQIPALSAAPILRTCLIKHLTSPRVKCCDDQLNP